MRHGERLHAAARLLELCGNFGDHRIVTANDGVLRPIERGDGNLRFAPGEERPHFGFAGEQHRHRAMLRDLLHQPATLGDEAERIGQRHHAGNRCGGVFTNAVPQQCFGLHAPLEPQRGDGVFECEERRLGEGGFVDATA